VTNTEWNGIIKLKIEVKCIRIILSPHLIDLMEDLMHDLYIGNFWGMTELFLE
jgi:hypothetical protein